METHKHSTKDPQGAKWSVKTTGLLLEGKEGVSNVMQPGLASHLLQHKNFPRDACFYLLVSAAH